MIKLICKNCHKLWYTANTEKQQVCPDCLSILNEEVSKLEKPKLNTN